MSFNDDIKTDKHYPDLNGMVMAVRRRLRDRHGLTDAFYEEARKMGTMSTDEIYSAALTAYEIQSKIDRILMMKGLQGQKGPEGQEYEDTLQALMKKSDEEINAEHAQVRAELVEKLANAVTGPASVAGPLLATFEAATQEFGKLNDAALAERCAALDALDHDDTVLAVVFSGEEQHFLHT